MERFETEITGRLDRKGMFDLRVFTLTTIGILENGDQVHDDSTIDAIALGFLKGKLDYTRQQVWFQGPTSARHLYSLFVSSTVYRTSANRNFLYSWSANPNKIT